MTPRSDADLLEFFRGAFRDRYDEDDDDAYGARVADNEPLCHPDVSGWCYRPADDALEPHPDWKGGDAKWRGRNPQGGRL